MIVMSRLKVLKNPFKKLVGRFENWDLRRLTRRFMIFGIILALVGSYFWYSRLYMTNERRFWTAINNSMSTRSVTRTLITGGTGNEVVQSQRFAFSPQMASESKVIFNQKSALINTAVVTEGILFPDAQYSRYVSFTTNQTKPDGSIPSLDDIVGKWEANEVAVTGLEQAKLSYVSELVSLIIIGNYDADFRNDIISSFRDNNIYDVSFDNISEDVVNGEDVIVFPVSVSLRKYATQVQRAFVRAGYGEFPPLNPENYREDSKISALILVSKRQNSITGVSFGQREEKYSGYGIGRTITRPEASYRPGELERLVQEEIQGIL